MDMGDSTSISSEEAMESRLLNALANLNRIGSTINRIGSGDRVDEQAALRMVVEGATQVIEGASALIYTYDNAARVFSAGSRVSAGVLAAGVPGEQPRPDGMGWRAIQQRRMILSYDEPNLVIDPNKVRAGARAVACFPLVVAEESLGVLYIYVSEERQFSSMERLMLENFVNQAAMALYQIQHSAEVNRNLVRKEEELERLRRAGLIISSRLRLEDTLEGILEMALEVTSAQYGIFRLVDPTGTRLVTQAVAGEGLGHPYVQALSLDSPSISTWVVHNRQPALISDLSAEPWSNIYYPLDAKLKMQSELAVPLISASGRILGVLNLESPYKNAFSDDDRILLQSFATQAVIAIQEVRLLDALQEIPNLLLNRNQDEVLARLCALACELLNAPSSAILINEGNALVLKSSHHAGEPGAQVGPLDEAVRSALRGIEVAFIDRTRVSADFIALRKAYSPWSHAWLAPFALEAEKSALGLFCVFVAIDPASQGSGEWEKKVVGMLSHFGGMAVLYDRHQQALRKAQEQHAVAEMFAAVGDLATNLLHQLNNKVGTIPVRVQGIQDKSGDVLAQDRYLANNLVEIERSATEAMVAVRKNLMHLHPVQMVPVNLAECVRAAIESASLDSRIQVVTRGLDALPDISGGQQSLKLVFTNLIENAAHAMGGKGVITICGSADEDGVSVEVIDGGPGIPVDMHERIFDLDYSTGKNAHAGKLGFGLWWVRALMMRLGGAVWVQSDGISGTTFLIRFPRSGLA